jgi:hypothetical protein
MTKTTGREYGQRHKCLIASGGTRYELAARQFRDIKFPPSCHAIKYFPRRIYIYEI